MLLESNARTIQDRGQIGRVSAFPAERHPGWDGRPFFNIARKGALLNGFQ